MNVYDSGRMADVLAPLGYRPVEGPEDADMVILNTCHIREKASEKVFSELGLLRAHKSRKRREGSDMIIAVAGCVAQAEGPEILARAPHVDIVVGPQTYRRLPDLIARVTRAGGVVDTDFPVEEKFDRLPKARPAQSVSAYLTVQEGCDRFCTFCVVPYTRGAEMSRPLADLIAEAQRLVAGRAREITLLGQNVNAYHGRKPAGAKRPVASLADLIARLSEIDGLERLRYTTSHPRDMTEDLIAAHRDLAKLMPHLHLPVQSGSDRVLKAMNRGHKASDYLRLVACLRKARLGIALSSDFIVGFPGETEADFRATLELAREVGFAQAYSFKYSPRPGTPAAERDDQVPEPVKSERLARLQERLNADQLAFNRTSVGREMDVLFERKGRVDGQLVGRSPAMQAVHARAPKGLLGRLARVRVSQAGPNSVTGEILPVAASAVGGGA